MKKLTMIILAALLLTLGGAALAEEDPTEPPTVETSGTGNGYTLTGVIGSGGGTATGSGYTLSGTIGQPSVSPTTSTGGNYTLRSGFWPRIAAPSGSPFDVNNDGFITPADAVLVANRLGEPVDNSNRFADVDGDNDIDQADVTAVMDRLGQTE